VLQQIDFTRKVGQSQMSDKKLRAAPLKTPHPRWRTDALRPSRHQPAVLAELQQRRHPVPRAIPSRLYTETRQDSHRYFSRSTRLRTLPDGLRGISSAKITFLGSL